MSSGSAERPGASTSVRLQKLLADAGQGSRRAMERRIADGDVKLNGEVAETGTTASTGDRITLDGVTWRVVPRPAFHRSIVYNKPLGEITTRSDPQGRPTVFQRLPKVKGGRWVAVGRLDINTTGLLLLTTDGELANAMMHPSNEVDREYACRIFGEVDEEMIARLKRGVELDDGPAAFGDVVASGGDGENRWFHVTLMEGRNREVRRLWASQGVTVSRLKRVRYGAVFLPRRLRMGEWSELSLQDHQVLREDVGLPPNPVDALSLRPEKDPSSRGNRRAPHRKGRGKTATKTGPRPKSARDSRSGSRSENQRRPKTASDTGNGAPTSPGRKPHRKMR